MKNKYTRRDSLKLMGSAVVGSQLVRGAQPLDAQTDGVRTVRAVSVDEDMRGIFVIMSTPYTESGAVHYDDLALLGKIGGIRQRKEFSSLCLCVSVVKISSFRSDKGGFFASWG